MFFCFTFKSGLSSCKSTANHQQDQIFRACCMLTGSWTVIFTLINLRHWNLMHFSVLDNIKPIQLVYKSIRVWYSALLTCRTPGIWSNWIWQVNVISENRAGINPDDLRRAEDRLCWVEDTVWAGALWWRRSWRTSWGTSPWPCRSRLRLWTSLRTEDTQSRSMPGLLVGYRETLYDVCDPYLAGVVGLNTWSRFCRTPGGLQTKAGPYSKHLPSK